MSKQPVTKEEERLLLRPTLAFHSFNDVFSEVLDINGLLPDFDAELTTYYRHQEVHDLRTCHPIGESRTRGAYGIELVTHLLDELRNTYRDRTRSRAVRIVANIAARTDANQTNNGSDFYLAILDNGIEVYATPLPLLTYVRGRVKSLFIIPNRLHPLFDGKREQFRSAVIAQSRYAPYHLKRITKTIIPAQKFPLELAYVDKYGNSRLRATTQLALGKTAEISINGFGINALVVESLNQIPENAWGLYRNPADRGDSTYYELVLKSYHQTRTAAAYRQLGRPQLGSEIRLKTKPR